MKIISYICCYIKLNNMKHIYLEQWGDFDGTYLYAVISYDGDSFNYKEAKESFKQYFKINTIDNSNETLDLFLEYIKKNYGVTYTKNFKTFTIGEM